MRFFDFFLIDVSRLAEGFRANSKVILRTTFVVVIVMCAALAIAFFMTLQGAEKVMVPEVEGKDISEALIEMQAKELYPRVLLRYSDRQDEKGMILEQEPKAGAIVKAGKRVSLVVSRGAIIDQVDNFIGQNIDDVRVGLQALFTSGAVPLLSVKEPVLYRASSEPAGTILEQDPAPETAITEPIQVSFVVSRGAERKTAIVPNITGKSIAEIVSLMEQTDLIFNFTARAPQAGETPGTAVSQLPAGDTSAPEFSTVNAVIAVPLVPPNGYVYGIFREELPAYPYPFQITLYAVLPSGERREYISVRHPGGAFSVPYLLPEGSMISLNVLNKETGLYEIAPVVVAGENASRQGESGF